MWLLLIDEATTSATSSLFGAEDMDQEDIPSNGNCLFIAIARQLEMAGIARTEQQVRAELVAYLKTNAEEVSLTHKSFSRAMLCIMRLYHNKCLSVSLSTCLWRSRIVITEGDDETCIENNYTANYSRDMASLNHKSINLSLYE